jgi:hypothetical protein
LDTAALSICLYRARRVAPVTILRGNLQGVALRKASRMTTRGFTNDDTMGYEPIIQCAVQTA